MSVYAATQASLFWLLIFAPSWESLLSNNWLCLSVRMSVTPLQTASFLFLGGIEPFFGRQFSMWHCTKRSSIFALGPNFQNLLPKICTQSPITPLIWQIERRCLDLPGGFGEWPIQWNHAKYCGDDPRCHGREIWARRGDAVAYRLVSFVSFSFFSA